MREVGRREFLRSCGLATAGLAAPAVLSACARKPSLQRVADARLAAGARQGLKVFPGGQDYVAGTDSYVALGLVAPDGLPAAGHDARVWLTPTANPKATVNPVGPLTAPWRGYTESTPVGSSPPGVHALEFRFPRAAIWTLLAETTGSDGTRLLGSVAVEVKAHSASPLPGDRAIPSQTPTLRDHRGVDPICTREPPCPLHEVTLADALALRRPVAFYVGTPKFCQSRVCGPNIEELLGVRREIGDRATFVHAEVYLNDDGDTIAKQIVSPAFLEWRFESEPWLFLIDRSGVVAARFEGPVTAPVIRETLAPLVG